MRSAMTLVYKRRKKGIEKERKHTACILADRKKSLVSSNVRHSALSSVYVDTIVRMWVGTTVLRLIRGWMD